MAKKSPTDESSVKRAPLPRRNKAGKKPPPNRDKRIWQHGVASLQTGRQGALIPQLRPGRPLNSSLTKRSKNREAGGPGKVATNRSNRNTVRSSGKGKNPKR